MIAHVVLLKPRPDLSLGQRRALADAFERAAGRIRDVRDVRIGSRVTSGLGYEHGMPDTGEFFAMLTFDDLAGLHAYLKHPAHEELGRMFGTVLSSAFVYDFEIGGLEMLQQLVGGG
jgi:hypothetical protein